MCAKMTIRLTFLLRYDDIYHLSRLSPTIFHQSFSFCRKDSGLIIQHFLHTFPHILPVFSNNINSVRVLHKKKLFFIAAKIEIAWDQWIIRLRRGRGLQKTYVNNFVALFL
jgi:hypothetical protein